MTQTHNTAPLSQTINTVCMDRPLVVTSITNPGAGEYYPLRFEGLVIALVREGKGLLGIDTRQYQLTPGSLLVIHPRNYVDYMDGTDLKMEVVASSTHVVESVLPTLTDITPLLLHHRVSPVTQLAHEDYERVLRFFTFLHSQLDEGTSVYARKKVLCLLQSLLFEMMDIEMSHAQPDTESKSRSHEIMSRFLLLVSDNFHTHRTVGWYADRLNISSKHLSAVVKTLSQRTAGDWIEAYVIAEAKVLLRTTDMPVQEIATRLGFPNQSFFGKYFKNQVGASPTEYRRQMTP